MTPMQKWHANASFCEGGVSAARWAQRFRRSRRGGPALNDCSQSFGRCSILATQGAFAALAPRAVSKIAMTFLGPAPYVAISHMDVSRFAAPMSSRTTGSHRLAGPDFQASPFSSSRQRSARFNRADWHQPKPQLAQCLAFNPSRPDVGRFSVGKWHWV